MTCAAVVAPEEEGGPKAKEDSAVAAAPAEGDEPENGRGPPSEFLVVSINVSDFAQASPHAELSRARGVVVAAYASVERVRKLPGWDGEIEWLMATASDARGVLPMWVQTLAVPGQIAKDVGLFLSWLARERTGENQPSSASEAPLPPPPVAAAGETPPSTSLSQKQQPLEEAPAPELQEPLVPTKAGEEEDSASAATLAPAADGDAVAVTPFYGRCQGGGGCEDRP